MLAGFWLRFYNMWGMLAGEVIIFHETTRWVAVSSCCKRGNRTYIWFYEFLITSRCMSALENGLKCVKVMGKYRYRDAVCVSVWMCCVQVKWAVQLLLKRPLSSVIIFLKHNLSIKSSFLLLLRDLVSMAWGKNWITIKHLKTSSDFFVFLKHAG